ncbi:aspartic protease, partial [Aphelenchoides avenae]
ATDVQWNTTSVPLRSYRDQLYAVPVDLGTPAQRLYLAVDAFGESILVPGPKCVECCRKDRFDPSKSNTCVYGSRNAFYYADPDIMVDKCSDKLTFDANVTLNNASLYVVLSTPPSNFFALGPSDGVLGLGVIHWDNAYHTAMMMPYVGIFLKATCTQDHEDNAGTLTIEEKDTENCDSTEIPVKLTEESSNKPVSAILHRLKIGEDPEVTGPWRATFTTASPDVVVPEALFERLNDKYRNATKDKDSGVWQIACSYKGQDEVHLMFEGETNPTFSFKLQHFIDQIGEKCVLRIRPKAREDANPDYWSMGLPFFRKYCANFYLD